MTSHSHGIGVYLVMAHLDHVGSLNEIQIETA